MMFNNFPNASRLWIYGFNKILNSQEQSLVNDILKEFTRSWTSHNDEVLADYALLEGRFAVLTADHKVSGCSIDSSVQVFKQLRNSHNLDALDQNLIFYRDELGNIVSCPRGDFQQRLDEDVITDDTLVFDLTINVLGDFKTGKFEKPFRESWHSRAFRRHKVLQK